jgi:hypothetical protein
MPRQSAFLLYRILYGELLSVNLREWLIDNQIDLKLLGEIENCQLD